MIIRRKINSNFTVISNEVILDTRLSISARWLLVYLLSRPADWRVQIKDIQRQGGIGREKAYKLVNELISANWVRRDIPRDADGQWSGIEYIVSDIQEVEEVSIPPFPENPDTVKPDTVNQHLTKDGDIPSTESTKSILVDDAEFDEFWAAYPSRKPHSNPKVKAKEKYLELRRKKNVSRETLVSAAKRYAAARAGEDPLFTTQAITWLNQWRFEDDYATDEEAAKLEPAATDEDLVTLEQAYPGHIGDRGRAKKLLAAEMSKGASITDLCAAAEKYRLFCKGPPFEDRRITPAMLETWLQFKWREMDAYEVCRVGADRIKTVRPIKVNK